MSKHDPCRCGRELADECMCPLGDPFGAFDFQQPIGSRSPTPADPNKED